jgi:hypothetical protein
VVVRLKNMELADQANTVEATGSDIGLFDGSTGLQSEPEICATLKQANSCQALITSLGAVRQYQVKDQWTGCVRVPWRQYKYALLITPGDEQATLLFARQPGHPCLRRLHQRSGAGVWICIQVSTFGYQLE